MMKNREIKRTIKELKKGDRIGESGIIFLGRNQQLSHERGTNDVYVYTMCPFCGTKKTQKLSNILRGNTSSCGCKKGYRSKKIRDDNGEYIKGARLLWGWVYEYDVGKLKGMDMVKVHSVWDPSDKDIMPARELDPEYNDNRVMYYSRWARNYAEANNIDFDEVCVDDDTAPVAQKGSDPDSRKNSIITVGNVQVECHGADEKWIKPHVLNNLVPGSKVLYNAYTADGGIFGQTDSIIRDSAAKYSDMRTLSQYAGWDCDIFEEYDACNHRINKPSARDIQVELGCALNNKGLFRISTRCHCIKNRDVDTFLAIRAKAMNIIRHNIAANAQYGAGLPTLVRVTIRNGVEQGKAKGDHVEWTSLAPISQFLMKY